MRFYEFATTKPKKPKKPGKPLTPEQSVVAARKRDVDWAKLPIAIQQNMIRPVRLFNELASDNDPHGEHDGATLTVGKYRIAWKINYYAPERRGDEKVEPTDPAATLGVMTIMFVDVL